MTKLASVFFLISDSLLWPVMILLLVGLAAALWRLGRTIRMAFERSCTRALRRDVAIALEKNAIDEAEQMLRNGKGVFCNRLRALFDAKTDHALLEKRFADLQIERASTSTLPKLLMKAGPALGLMGTLIPLGPALVGLATGRLDALAQNLAIAFATTVVGLAVSLLAFVSSLLEKRWDRQDAALAAFVVERLIEGEPKEERA